MKKLGAVLAGGASSRFGSDKALARIGDLTLLDHARAALARLVGTVVVVGRDGGVADRPGPGLGPLGGIAGALDHARRNGFASVLTIGCDMPEAPAPLLAALLATAPAYCPDAPVLGHWPAGLADDLAARLAAAASSLDEGAIGAASTGRHMRSSALSVRRWAESIGAVAISSPSPLRNVNTPADLAS